MTVRVAYVLDEDGLYPVRFQCDGDRCTNVDELSLRPGAVLDFGNGLVLTVAEMLGALE